MKVTSLQSLLPRIPRSAIEPVAYTVCIRANDMKTFPFRPSRQICGHLVLPHRSFVGGGSPLCLMMKGSPSRTLYCSFIVASFSLVPLSYTQVSWSTGRRTALKLIRLPPILPFPVKFLGSVRIEDIVHTAKTSEEFSLTMASY